MNVESYYATGIAAAARSDWLKNLAPVFQLKEVKTKPIAPCKCDFSLVSSKVQVITRNSDWSIALFAPVVIGYLGISFSTVI